ncbi:low-density lipoprotein receptor-related protein 2-like isoform X2 [Dreissena polymorpha]|uniref:low-density lipoprotein receptor-related protein 2-like isoform X2 n=1 Tax=Dreissena polymorpha TaxID=45954 RepID=UPI0022647377|nr:low-density lipoprotein receptor-related protein 2-like isoform X2 [Dreissena polymorpha]
MEPKNTGILTPIPEKPVGVVANLTVWVYTLSYSGILRDRNSRAFLDLANPFCEDIGRIILESYLRDRYVSCEVFGFGAMPDVAIAHVRFAGDSTKELELYLARLIMDRARNVTVEGRRPKMLGTLLITPADGDGKITVLPISVNPTIMSTPTTPSDIDECLELGICKNGGTCINTQGSFLCNCPPEWTGKFCEIDINECSLNPCLNGATCINNLASFVCVCLPDYTGRLCEIGIFTASKLSFPTLNLTYTPDLASNKSLKFQRISSLFCKDINQLMATHRSRFPDYQDCVINSFKDNPTRMEWELKFKGKVPAGTEENAKTLIMESFQRQIYGDYLGILIGDILFYLDDYKSTKIRLDKPLLNFTSLPAFQNNRSLEYQTAEELLCADVDRIIKNHPDKFQNYVDCKL